MDMFSVQFIEKVALESLTPINISHYPRVETKPCEEWPFELGLYELSEAASLWKVWWNTLSSWNGDRPKTSYHVVLSQATRSDEGDGERAIFLLHSTKDSHESYQAFDSIQQSLAPLMESSYVSFDASFLSSLLLPFPRPLTELPSILLQLGRDQYVDAKFAGRSLLHLACEANDENSFEVLLEKGADIKAIDDKLSDSVLHCAVKYSLTCLNNLLNHATKLLSKNKYLDFLHYLNSSAHSALHTAVLHKNTAAVEALVTAGAKLIFPAAKESILHTAAREDCHECISRIFKRHGFLQPIGEEEEERKVDQEKALSNRNTDGDTPLLVAVRKKHLKSALHLVLEGADTNESNSSTLDTPLHIAAQECDVTIIQLLIVFGAFVSTRNRQGKTPIDLVREVHTHQNGREESIKTIEDVIAEETKEVAPLPNLTPLPEGSAVLLSLDGGGIRGLVLAQLLLALHDRVKEVSPKSPHLSTFFDWVTGTSTGGFMGLALVHYRASPTVCRKLYFHFKNRALVGSRVYPANDIELAIKEEFGHTDKMADITGPKFIMTTCLADQLPPVLHLMCNYGDAQSDHMLPSNLPIWEAARASSAAPTYFPPFRKMFLDGGMMANNPTLDAMTEIFSRAEKEGQREVKLGCIISLGTGVPPTTKLSGGANVVNPHNPMDVIRDVEAMKNLIDLFIAQSTTSYGQEVEQSRAWCKSMGTPFFRFSPPIDNIMLDETDDVKLIKMLYDTMLYTLENRAEYDQLAKLLLTKYN